ncbi:iron-sulfur cluster repair di-iron protein [Yersinia entomophaga]|uniref:Iron-sulfur cluster repair di-iron protein n=1 Tax=Yersinia entomophaga TaxID=935293 RepID=A0ABM6BMT3_YERET|nr:MULTISPECIES: iron-sulfur cluster repair protein YtfE [Yersinia]ANI30716.1 iron-sulfur cluster repair di-iron protein [Yersinia entomophaga]OWF85628.1 iron-sulfur cluster repair di-iron protein [Yersinia entomophaga]
MDYRNQSLGSLAIAIPRATTLFRRYELDFCCGGKQTLQRAAERRALNIDALEAELTMLQKETQAVQNWQEVPQEHLISFILNRYHERHREQLPELVLMAEKVERVHAAKPTCPRGLAVQLSVLHQDLLQHMEREEKVLFPMIAKGMGKMASVPIFVMESEHEAAGQQLETIKQITNNITPPPGACTTWRALYANLNEFVGDLMEHVHLENNLLFPRALSGN